MVDLYSPARRNGRPGPLGRAQAQRRPARALWLMTTTVLRPLPPARTPQPAVQQSKTIPIPSRLWRYMWRICQVVTGM